MDIAFADGDSFIHRLDPRARILAAFSLSTILAVSDRPAATALGLIAALALVGLARLRPSRLLWHVAAVNAFLLVLWAILPVATPGEIVARLGPLAVTRELPNARAAYFAPQLEATWRRLNGPELDSLLLRSMLWRVRSMRSSQSSTLLKREWMSCSSNALVAGNHRLDLEQRK